LQIALLMLMARTQVSCTDEFTALGKRINENREWYLASTERPADGVYIFPKDNLVGRSDTSIPLLRRVDRVVSQRGDVLRLTNFCSLLLHGPISASVYYSDRPTPVSRWKKRVTRKPHCITLEAGHLVSRHSRPPMTANP
jgi:hypothetical protein